MGFGLVAGSDFDIVIVIGLAVFDTCFGMVVVASVGEGMQYASGEITLSNHWPQENTKT